jgi:preprotein translocase subunit SecG
VLAPEWIVWGDVWPWLPPLLNAAILIIGFLLMVLILIQRGKGGGLAGAFGGAGGSSAFGSRAGDKFTRATIYLAAVWILLTMLMVRLVNEDAASRGGAAAPAKTFSE